MVRYVEDKTGRFKQRPHYTPKELDRECEKLVCDYLRDKHNKIEFPVDTEDLKSLIERDAHELDCYADLTLYGNDVEGVTEFRPGKKPIVRISAKLTEDVRYENRLRTTLTHEYGHVHFHSYLFSLNESQGKVCSNFTQNHAGSGPLLEKSEDGVDLINLITSMFKVSTEAARIRLLKLEVLRGSA